MRTAIDGQIKNEDGGITMKLIGILLFVLVVIRIALELKTAILSGIGF